MSCSKNGAILLICGLPGSGKTQLISDICYHIKYSTTAFTHIDETVVNAISFDDFLTTVTTNAEEWKVSRQHFQRALEHYIAYVLEIPKSTIGDEDYIYYEKILSLFPKQPNQKIFTFLLDDNFYYFSMRHEWYKVASKYKLGFGQVFLKCPVALALTRNSKRPEKNRIPENVITRMENRAEWPNPNNDKTHCHSFIIQSEDCSRNKVAMVLRLIHTVINDPVIYLEDKREEREVSKMELSKNLIHQSDIILRKLVSNIFQKEVSSKSNAQKISNARLSILSKIKAKTLTDLEVFCEDFNLEKLSEKLEQLFFQEIKACEN